MSEKGQNRAARPYVSGVMKRTFVAFLLFACAAPALASAQSPADAQRALQRRQQAVERIMQRPNNAAREQALSREIRGLLDLEELSRRALGDHWGSLSEAQRQEFVELLRQLVERSYRSNLDRTLRYQVDYQNAEARGGTVHVRTEARNTRNRREPPVRIEYDMHQRGGEWRVFDLTIDDGLSMVTNYRRQFDRIIEREGFEGLLGKMRERLEAGGS